MVPEYGYLNLVVNLFYFENNKAKDFSFFFFSFFVFCLFRATPMAYGGSQARGPIKASAAGLCNSHSNVGSEPHLQAIP